MYIYTCVCDLYMYNIACNVYNAYIEQIYVYCVMCICMSDIGTWNIMHVYM